MRNFVISIKNGLRFHLTNKWPNTFSLPGNSPFIAGKSSHHLNVTSLSQRKLSPQQASASYERTIHNTCTARFHLWCESMVFKQCKEKIKSSCKGEARCTHYCSHVFFLTSNQWVMCTTLGLAIRNMNPVIGDKEHPHIDTHLCKHHIKATRDRSNICAN